MPSEHAVSEQLGDRLGQEADPVALVATEDLDLPVAAVAGVEAHMTVDPMPRATEEDGDTADSGGLEGVPPRHPGPRHRRVRAVLAALLDAEVDEGRAPQGFVVLVLGF